DRFPLCGIGMADDPGSCDDAGGGGAGHDGGEGGDGGDGADAAGGSGSADGADGEEKGCATVPLAPGLGLLVGLAALAGRRRETR
ncbi:MAG: hypothetical protein VX265_11055, partial [Myxococcota bacterium]|nr:hypothetical protein [Myxococcota bacterium]